MEKKSNIGLLDKLTNIFISKVVGWFTGSFAIFFYLCLYDEKELSDRFINSELLIKKRKSQLKFLDFIADKTHYTREFFLSMIRVNLPKIYKKYPTLSALKTAVESGTFTGISTSQLIKDAESRRFEFFDHLFLNGTYKKSDINFAAPNFQTDFVKRVYNPNDPFRYDPANPGLTQAEIDAQKQADAQAQKQAVIDATAAKNKKQLMLGGGVGLAILALVTISKKK
jgi:hypothetical protein